MTEDTKLHEKKFQDHNSRVMSIIMREICVIDENSTTGYDVFFWKGTTILKENDFGQLDGTKISSAVCYDVAQTPSTSIRHRAKKNGPQFWRKICIFMHTNLTSWPDDHWLRREFFKWVFEIQQENADFDDKITFRDEIWKYHIYIR